MKILVLVFALLLPFAGHSLPVVGETVVYTGQSRMADGLYDIKKTVVVTAFNSQSRAYTITTTFEQAAEGAPMGAVDHVAQVPESFYQMIELGLLPLLKTDCGQSFPTNNPAIQTFSRRDVVASGLGDLETCLMEYPVQGNDQTVTWWSEQTKPWPAKGTDRNLLDGTELTITIQSITRP